MPFLLPNQQRQSTEGNQSTEDKKIASCQSPMMWRLQLSFLLLICG